MALQMSYTDDATGASFGIAYCRVTHVNLNVLSKGAEIVVSIYRDAGARNDGKAALHPPRTHAITGADYDTLFAPAVLDSVNPVKQAYVALKGLADYAGAQDV